MAAIFAGIVYCQTQPAAGSPAAAARNLRQRIVANLNLTDAQKQQVKSIFERQNQSAQPLRQQILQNRQALNQAMKSDNPGQIQSLSTTLGNLQGQLAAARNSAMAQVYALLTPEQKTKFDQIERRLGASLKQPAARLQNRLQKKNQ